MPGVCGLACEICLLIEEGCLCGGEGGCTAGTDPRAQNKLNEYTARYGSPCPVLKCAIENERDYCFRCDDFPCEIHDGFLYHASFLDWVRKNRPRSQV